MYPTEGLIEMSRYSLEPKREGSRVDVGYDPLLDTFFLQVRWPDARGATHLKIWRGHGVGGPEIGGCQSIPEEIIEEAGVYAAIPSGLLEALLVDRNQEPIASALDPVTYAGMPNGEMWRHRRGIDPTGGALLELRPSRVFAPKQQIAMVLLCDFLGCSDRARRLARDFAQIVMGSLADNRPWLFTELDMQDGIRRVEELHGWHWIEEAKCYAGEGKRVKPEVQLRRAGRCGRRHRSQLVAAPSGAVSDSECVSNSM